MQKAPTPPSTGPEWVAPGVASSPRELGKNPGRIRPNATFLPQAQPCVPAPRAVPGPRLRAAGTTPQRMDSGTLLTPKKEGSAQKRPGSWGLRPVRTCRGALPYLSSLEPGATLSLPRTGSEPAKPGVARTRSPYPSPAPPPWRPAPGVPRRVLAADEVCAQGTQEFPAPCKGQRSDGAEMSTLRWSKDNRHRWLQGNRARVRALRGMKTQARAAGKGGLRLGQARLRGPSRCRASAQKRSRGPPRGWFRRLLQQPPQAPGRRRAHLMRGGRPCRGRGSASGKESVVPGPTRPER